MYPVAFSLALVTVYVAAELPAYIHVCGRKDPNLDQCIMNNIENLKPRICEGMPELSIESNNPLHLEQFAIFDTSSGKLYMRDLNITGLCDIVTNFFHLDINKLHYDIELFFKQIQINGNYDLNLHLLVPIVNKGQFSFTTDNLGIIVNGDMKLITKNNQKYIYTSKVTTNLDIKEYNIEFSNDKNSTSDLYEIIQKFLGNNREEIIKNFKPVVEEEISKQIILKSNEIVKHFTYDEVLPDRI